MTSFGIHKYYILLLRKKSLVEKKKILTIYLTHSRLKDVILIVSLALFDMAKHTAPNFGIIALKI